MKVHTKPKIHRNHLEVREAFWVVSPDERSQGSYVENTSSSSVLQ